VRGDSTVVIKHTSYLIGVINLGVIVQSAYLAIRDDGASSNQMMEYLLAKPYSQSINRIKSFVDQCRFDRQGRSNARLNLMSLSNREWGDRSNIQVAEEVS
jgi:hypothetical protein